jgi:hypothetical protein
MFMDASLTRALMKARTVLDEEIAAAQAKVAELTLERQGIDAALKRFADTPTTTPATPEPAAGEEVFSSNGQLKEPGGPTDNSALNSRVLDLLLNADQPVHIGEIATALSLDITQARSAVAYLNRRSKVRNVRRGFWTAAASTDTETVPASTETVSAPIHQQKMEGGGADGTDLDSDHGQYSSWQADDRNHRHGAPVGAD